MLSLWTATVQGAHVHENSPYGPVIKWGTRAECDEQLMALVDEYLADEELTDLDRMMIYGPVRRWGLVRRTDTGGDVVA